MSMYVWAWRVDLKNWQQWCQCASSTLAALKSISWIQDINKAQSDYMLLSLRWKQNKPIMIIIEMFSCSQLHRQLLWDCICFYFCSDWFSSVKRCVTTRQPVAGRAEPRYGDLRCQHQGALLRHHRPRDEAALPVSFVHVEPQGFKKPPWQL